MHINSNITNIKNDEQNMQKEESELIAYVLSHDFKKPLRVLEYAYSELINLYQNTCIPSNDSYLQDIGKAIQEMQVMLNALHNYINLGIYPPTLTKINGDEIVNKVIQNLSPQITANKVIIEYNQKLPNILGTEQHLTYLFSQLIENAIKFKRDGIDPIIKINFTETAHELQCVIRDNGLGIEEEFFEIIFILFQRLYTQEEIPGYGIGLAICKRIVELWGGKIEVRSKVNYGSEFYLTLKK